MKSLLVRKPLLYISNFTGLVGRKPLEAPSWCLHVVQSVCLREPGCIYVQFNLSVNDQRSDTKATTGAFTEVDRDENIKKIKHSKLRCNLSYNAIQFCLYKITLGQEHRASSWILSTSFLSEQHSVLCWLVYISFLPVNTKKKHIFIVHV